MHTHILPTGEYAIADARDVEAVVPWLGGRGGGAEDEEEKEGDEREGRGRAAAALGEGWVVRKESDQRAYGKDKCAREEYWVGSIGDGGGEGGGCGERGARRGVGEDEHRRSAHR